MNYELEDSMLYENENRIGLIKLFINGITIQMGVTWIFAIITFQTRKYLNEKYENTLMKNTKILNNKYKNTEKN